MQMVNLRKDIFKDWPFTCTYCSIVLCFDVRSTWEFKKINNMTIRPFFLHDMSRVVIVC